MRLLLLAVAGAAGALCRYGIYRWLAVDVHGTFPWATVVANCVGSLLFGLVVVLADEAELLSADQRVIVLAGFLGAFTTFSTFAFETTTLLQTGHLGRALLNVLVQNAGAVLCVLAGISLGRSIAN